MGRRGIIPSIVDRSALAVLVLAWLAAGQVAAQEPDSRFVEAIEVRVVEVDVVVADRRGNPVGDLRREEFQLLVDGKPTEISYFMRVVEGTIEEASAPDDASLPPAVASRVPVTWAVFFDRRDLRPSVRIHALQQLTEFLERVMESGDRGIVATFDGRALRVRGGVTEDRSLLMKTLGQVVKERSYPDVAAVRGVTLRTDIRNAHRDPGAPEVNAMMLAHQVTAHIESEAHRSRNGMLALSSYLEVLAGIEGRYAIVYVGPGFVTLPALAINDLWHREFSRYSREQWAPRPEDQQAKLEEELERLLNRISTRRAALYSLYTGDTSDGAAEDDLASPGDRAETHAVSLAREMAERTGGTLLKGRVAVAQQLATVQSDLRHYYSLGYVARGPAGRTEKIVVRVARPGVVVRHRRAAHERSDEERAADSVVAALFAGEQENPLGVVVEAERSRRAARGKDRILPVRLRIPLESLTFLPDGDIYRAELSFYFALGGGDGTILRLDSRELPLSVPKEELEVALRKGITYSVEVPLPPGVTRLSVVVHDRTALVRSTVTLGVE